MTSSSPQAGVVGATGYTGAELVGILHDHPDLELSYLASQSHAGSSFSSVHPRFKSVVDKQCEPLDIQRISRLDIVFLAVPHTVSMGIVSRLDLAEVKVVDLAADYRLPAADLYESTYGVQHIDPKNLQRSVYGLVEHNRTAISDADLVANPGCYATAVLLPLVQLSKAGLISGSVFVDAKSGISGAGRKPSPASTFVSCNEDIRPYKIGVHRHQPEIAAHLPGEQPELLFVPHLIPVDRGIEAAIYFQLADAADFEAADRLFEQLDGASEFLRYRSQPAGLKSVVRTPYCDISLFRKGRNAVVFSLLDNLLKGAASQAVQNANLMLGLEESSGLLPPGTAAI